MEPFADRGFGSLSSTSLPGAAATLPIALAFGACVLFVLRTFPDTQGPYGLFDFASSWGAGRALLGGLDPYDPSQNPIDFNVFAYPPVIALAMVPFGLL